MGDSRTAAGWARLFDAGLAVNPPLSAEELLAIPAKRGVFLLAGPGAEPILLATAADIRARVRHRLAAAKEGSGKRADLREIAAHVWWKLSDSHFETNWHYLRLARSVHPDTYRGLLSPRQAWWVHIDLADAAPALRRTKDVFARGGQYLGPFADKHAAQRFIEALVDAFDLCRCEQILRRAPNGRACVYAQMGRCRAYCDGSAEMGEYRELLAQVCRYASGDRQELREAVEEDMRRLADEKEYELAAACKARLDRLAELEAGAFAHVADAQRFQYLYFQPGAGPQKAKTFLVDRGRIKLGAAVKYPLQTKQLQCVIEAMLSFAATSRTPGVAEQEGAALVAHYLFAPAERRGLPIRTDADLTAAALAERIESAEQVLRLRKPAPKKRKKSPARKAR